MTHSLTPTICLVSVEDRSDVEPSSAARMSFLERLEQGEPEVKNAIAKTTPPKTIIAFGRKKVPTGWVRCDGSTGTNDGFVTLFDVEGLSLIHI